MAPKRLLVLLGLSLLAALACTLPFGLGPLVNPDLVPTLVQQTMQALEEQAFSPTPPGTLVPEATPTPANTSVPSFLTVSTPTWCYSGPGASYGRIANVSPATQVAVIGQDPGDNYWIVEVPSHPESVCWLSGQRAQLSGDTASLPQFPTPQPSLFTLSEPKNVKATCSSVSAGSNKSTWTVVLRWTNTEPNQLGVRIFRDGRQIATLRQGARSYAEEFTRRDKAGGVTYGVQAYGPAGVSSIVTTDLRHCD